MVARSSRPRRKNSAPLTLLARIVAKAALSRAISSTMAMLPSSVGMKWNATMPVREPGSTSPGRGANMGRFGSSMVPLPTKGTSAITRSC